MYFICISLSFKIDNSKLGSAKQFSYGNFDFKIEQTKEQPKHPKGITDIPADIDFNQFKSDLMTNPLVRDVTKTKSGHAAVTFLSNSTPTSVNG